MKKSLILLGTDTELFLRDKETGNYKSAVGLIGGSKDFPRPLDKDGCCLQEDNVSVEYNVPPVGLQDSHEMWENIKYVTESANLLIPDNLELVCCSSARLNEEELQTPQAQTLG